MARAVPIYKKPVVHIAAGLTALGALAFGLYQSDQSRPVNPPRFEQARPSSDASQVPIAIPTAAPNIIAPPTAAAEPVSTPVVSVPVSSDPIVVECNPYPCTSQELEYYNKRFREELAYLTNLFGITPKRQIRFKRVDENTFLYYGDRWNAFVGIGQITPEGERGGITHELTHALLQTDVRWYDEGLANVGAATKYYINDIDPSGDVKFYHSIRDNPRIAEISPYKKGFLFFHVLRREYGWNPSTDPVPRQLYDSVENGTNITDDYIFNLYEQSLGKNLSELRNTMSYMVQKFE